MTYLNWRPTDPGAIRRATPELFDDECEPLKTSVYSYLLCCIMLNVDRLRCASHRFSRFSDSLLALSKPERIVIGFKKILSLQSICKAYCRTLQTMGKRRHSCLHRIPNHANASEGKPSTPPWILLSSGFNLYDGSFQPVSRVSG